MKWFKRILILLVLLIAVVVYLNYPKLNIISGYASKYMASSVLIGGHSPAYVNQNDLQKKDKSGSEEG